MSIFFKKILNSITLFLFVIFANAQNSFLQGTILDENNKPLEKVNISIVELKKGTVSDSTGNFRIELPSDTNLTLFCTYVGLIPYSKTINLKKGETKILTIKMFKQIQEIKEVLIKDEQIRTTTMMRIDPKNVEIIPSVTGSVESILFSLPGVSSYSELSSQYSVRGGNYDENLVYVNDIEVFRPLLVRDAQQEGLSFINPDLVSSIKFSAGGFEARYGDKMSSVLDIKYKKPREFSGSVAVSLLGANIHIEDATDNYRLTQIYGLRYRTNQYLLNSLDVQGDYKPSFLDFQSYITYDLTDKWELALLTNMSRNKYLFVPETRKTKFGTINQALQLTIYYDGQEIDNFNTFTGAIAATNKLNNKTTLKFIASSFYTSENISFDLDGQYFIDELERDFSKKNFGDVAFNRGVGEQLKHARNKLFGQVYSFYHKGFFENKNKEIQWGTRYQHEIIDDIYKEWIMIDSAGYSLPQYPPDKIILFSSYRTKNFLETNRLTGYIQQSIEFDNKDSANFNFTYGLRLHYWDLNKQLLFSPRVNLSFKPNWNKDFLFRISSGFYLQPPFYRELRDLQGIVHKNVKAQESYHLVLGNDYNFKVWNRPFKLVSELYYKYMRNINPYEIDNLQIKYYAKNNAIAYATGIDLRINGEFIKGVDSWASLSFMQTKEDLLDDYYYDYFNKEGEKIIKGFTFDQTAVDSVIHKPGYIPRLTDRRVNFGLFFQDYLPNNPEYKMHLNLLFGTALPFGPPDNNRYRDTLRMPPYKRVDIGFSKVLKKEDKQLPDKNPFHFFSSIWLTAEIFNLIQANNTISYLWVQDVTGRQYAVPNYMTGRRINVKILFKF